MMKSTLLLASLVVSGITARTAAADDLQPAPSSASDEPSVAITASPFHLLIPMVELTGEFRVTPKFGVAVIAGVGGFRDQDTNAKINLYEGGVSARYYVTGSFRSGLQIGAEAAYVKADTDNTSVEVKAAGLALSPFAGYKWTHSSGFTLEGQLGAAFMVAKAKAETGEMAEANKVGPMLNLNVGYSF